MTVHMDAVSIGDSASEQPRLIGASPMMAEIQDAVCRLYQISLRDLLSDRRERRISRPRQIGMYLARELTHRSYPEIGRFFGNRDHTTAIHGARTIEQMLKTNAEMTADVSLLRLSIALTMKARLRRQAAL